MLMSYLYFSCFQPLKIHLTNPWICFSLRPYNYYYYYYYYHYHHHHHHHHHHHT